MQRRKSSLRQRRSSVEEKAERLAEEALTCYKKEMQEYLEDQKTRTATASTGVTSREASSIQNVPQQLDLTPSERSYFDACRLFNVTPSTSLLNQRNNLDMATEINLRHRSLGVLSIKALTVGLLDNSKIRKLLIAENKLGPEGASYIGELLTYNRTLKELDIADNEIEAPGVLMICKGLQSGSILTKLNLSGNRLNHRAAVYLTESLLRNRHLLELDLSYNEFCEQSGIELARLILENRKIEILNLKWNHIRMMGAVEIAKSLEMNKVLRVLDFSWNGFGNEGSLCLGDSLKANDQLEYLDLSNNRIDMEGIGFIIRGLKRNSSLSVLKLSQNLVTSTGASMLLQVPLDERSGLKVLELRDIVVDPEFDVVLAKVHEMTPDFVVIHGGYVNHEDVMARLLSEKDVFYGDPLSLLLEYVKAKNLRLMDIFSQFDKDNSQSVSHEEFKAGIRMAGIPMTDSQFQGLVRYLDADDDGEIDFGELIRAQNAYRKRRRKMNHWRRAKETMGLFDRDMSQRAMFSTKSLSSIAAPTKPKKLDDVKKNGVMAISRKLARLRMSASSSRPHTK